MNLFGQPKNKREEAKWLGVILLAGVAFLLFQPFIILKRLGKKVFRIGQRKV